MTGKPAKSDESDSASGPLLPKLKPDSIGARSSYVAMPKLKPTSVAAAEPPPSVPEYPPVTEVPEKSDRVLPAPPNQEAAVIIPQLRPPLRQLRKAEPKLDVPSPRVPANPMPDGTLAGEACLQALRILRVDFAQAATPVSAGACSVEEPVRLSSMTVGGAQVKFPDKPLLTCGFAARFAAWVANEGAPAVRSSKGSALQALGTGPDISAADATAIHPQAQ